jgi:hypothetical protein
MNSNLINFAAADPFSRSPQPVTRDMVRSRTVELALHSGRKPIEIRQSDYERAKREITGESDSHRQLHIMHPDLLA